jgi:hypothetical protein
MWLLDVSHGGILYSHVAFERKKCHSNFRRDCTPAYGEIRIVFMCVETTLI